MTNDEGSIEIRLRTGADLDVCADLGCAVRALDGYPPYLPDDDFRLLLTRPEPLCAWVAVDDEQIVGHAALHPSRPGTANTLAAQVLARPPAQMGVVARLFSAPTHRRASIGRRLLGTVADAARARGLVPILDVWVELDAAIALYESCGWTKLGTIDARLPDGRLLTEHIFAAP